MPRRAWVWRQRWDSVLLLHYRVAASVLHPLVPAALDLEEHAGSAWLSLVPFRMRDVRPRLLPPAPWVSNFPELNLRTYVRHADRPGVFFLRIQAGGRAAARLARLLSPLPYEYAPMAWCTHGAGVSVRTPGLAIDFAAGGPLSHTDPLDGFLTERYCLYAATAHGVTRADVHHVQWPLLRHRVRIDTNRLLTGFEISRPNSPDHSHFSPGVEVVGWTSERIQGAAHHLSSSR